MDFVELGPIGTRKFWKIRNKKNKLPKENRLMPTRDVKHYFKQIVAGIYHSKDFAPIWRILRAFKTFFELLNFLENKKLIKN